MDALTEQILRDRLMVDEGLRLKPYYDSLGFPTQGVGHKLSNERYADLSAWPDITEDHAMAWLDDDIAAASDQAAAEFTWFAPLDGIRQGVIIEMVFQLGIERVLGFKHMIIDMARGNYSNAADEMISSLWHTETPKRCEHLAAIMRTGDANAQAQEA